jgi:hypothetical protein
LGFVPLAIDGAAALGVSPSMTPAPATGVKTVSAEAKLADSESWFMGGSGQPIPSLSEVEKVADRFNPATPLFDGQPQFPVDALNRVFTPEGLYPLTGVKSLELDASVAQGVTIIDNVITDQIAAGNHVVVEGGSQSATIESLEMRDLLALPEAEQPTAEQLSFVVLGDPSNPDGGVLERFNIPGVPLSLPSWGVTFSGATPAESPWDTAVYTLEYDGFADWPRYPLNFLSDLNALLGIAAVHPTYPDLSDDRMASTIELPVSDDYTGDAANTQYFMIPTETLPLLQPLQYIPVLGQPLYDLLEPDMRVLVNLGYGDIDHGWDQGPANVPTPFGLFPDVGLGDVLTALGNGAQQGIHDFVDDLGSLDLGSLSGIADAVAETAADPPGFTDVVNTVTDAFASAYAALLPIADTFTVLNTTMPTYDDALFAHELASGNLLDAIGLPIAANLGVGSVVSFVGIGVPILHAAENIIDDFQDLFPG